MKRITVAGLRRSIQRLTEKARAVDVIEYAWCQRGASGELVRLVCVLPTTHKDLGLCLFKTRKNGIDSWFTGRLYLTKKATTKAGLIGRMLFCTEVDRRTYGISTELVDYPFSALKDMLKKHGMPDTILNAIIYQCGIQELANAEAALQPALLAA